MKWMLDTQDVIAWASQYNGEPFHAMLCDPPYEIGFMCKKWDRSGIAFRSETWASLANHLHPGAFIMAFASARGWHRQAVAMEDAGLIMHPTLFGWAYGSGFPKATRIDTQIDERAGAVREVISRREKHDIRRNVTRDRQAGIAHGQGKFAPGSPNIRMIYEDTAPATEMAKTWAGHRYGMQAIKPAIEPILVFQKPYRGKAIDCITQSGAGAIWIDGARIPDDQSELSHSRWPSNLLLLDNGSVSAIDKQASASDYFFKVKEQIDIADPIYYVCKPSRSERDAGCEMLPDTIKAMGNQAAAEIRRGHDPTITIDKKAGMSLARVKNYHPTVKPLALSRYLATLMLPPGDYAPRRILVPFAGSGSEMIGALHAGWEIAHGIEGEADHVTIAEARLMHWVGKQSSAELTRQVASRKVAPSQATLWSVMEASA